MRQLVAVGYPGWQNVAHPWDWWPLVGIALTLWFLRFVLHHHFDLGSVVLALGGGLLFASTVHAWGLTGGIATWLVLDVAALILRGRDRRNDAPPV
jgi:hypothetical protein